MLLVSGKIMFYWDGDKRNGQEMVAIFSLSAKHWVTLYLHYVKLAHDRGTRSSPFIYEKIEFLKAEITSSRLYKCTRVLYNG